MANGSTTLARIQGQGLVETAPVGVTEMQGAGFSPAGALQKGLSPDAAKMAGTPPAKVNAIKMAMQDVGSRRLESLRETAQTQFVQDQRAVAANIQVTAAKRLDNIYQDYLTRQIRISLNNTILNQSTQGARERIVYPENQQAQNALRAAIAKVNTDAKNVTTQEIDVINAALEKVKAPGLISFGKDTGELTNSQLIAQNLYYNLTNAEMVKAFSDAVGADNIKTKVGDFLQSDEVDQYAKGLNLPKETPDITDKQALEDLLKSIVPDPEQLSSMQMGDLVTAIQKWRTEEFKDVAEYERILVDPTSSPAKLDFAKENLRRLGRVGVLSADEKINNLDAQMRDGDTLLVDGQEFPIDEFFTEAAGVSQLKQWLAQPQNAPANIRQWIEKNRDAIQSVINDLNPDMKVLSDRVDQNMQAIKLPENVQLDEDLGKYFFGDALYKRTLEAKLVPEKFKLLQDGNVGPNMVNLMNKLRTLPAGLDGKQIFNNLSLEQLRTISTQNKVDQYITNLQTQKVVKDFVDRPSDANSFVGDFASSMDKVGLKDVGLSLSRLAGGKDLSEFRQIFDKAGLSGELLAGNQLNIATLKQKLKEFSQVGADGLIDANDSAWQNTKNYFNGIIDKIRGALSSPPQNTLPPTSELEKQFRKEQPGIHPEDFIKKAEEQVRLAQARRDMRFNFPPDWAKTSDAYGSRIYSVDEWKAKEPRAKFLGADIGKGSGWTEWQQRLEWLEGTSDEFKIPIENAEKELQKERMQAMPRMVNYSTKLGNWISQKRTAIAQENAKLKTPYDKLQSILAGAA